MMGKNIKDYSAKNTSNDHLSPLHLFMSDILNSNHNKCDGANEVVIPDLVSDHARIEHKQRKKFTKRQSKSSSRRIMPCRWSNVSECDDLPSSPSMMRIERKELVSDIIILDFDRQDDDEDNQKNEKQQQQQQQVQDKLSVTPSSSMKETNHGSTDCSPPYPARRHLHDKERKNDLPVSSITQYKLSPTTSPTISYQRLTHNTFGGGGGTIL